MRPVNSSLVRKVILSGIGIVLVSAVAVPPAHSQFGIDIAAILAGLQQINSTLNSAVHRCASVWYCVNCGEPKPRVWLQSAMSQPDCLGQPFSGS